MKTILAIILALSTVSFASDNIVVLFDNSGSMSDRMGSEAKSDIAKKALNSVIDNMSDDTKLGVIVLNGTHTGEWVFPIQPLNKNMAKNAVNSIPIGGSTPLGECLRYANDALIDVRKKEHYGTYRMVVVTDGAETDSDTLRRNWAEIKNKSIIVDVIGVAMSGDHVLAREVRSYRRANDSAALTQAIKEVMAEIKVGKDDVDYEILEGLSPDAATKIIGALAPLDLRVGEHTAIVNGVSTNVAPAETVAEDSGLGWWWALIILGIIVIGIIVIGSILD